MRSLRLTILLFGGIFLSACSSLPKGTPGPRAEELAQKMLAGADVDKWQATAAVSFTFRGGDKIFWDRKRKLTEVIIKKKLVQFSEVSGKSVCFEEERRVTDDCADMTETAIKRFYNHTFWLNPAFHISSPGTERALVGDNQLLVSFKSGGSTPGDSYLFTLDEEGKIAEMRMWVSVLPIKGARAVFSNYTKTQTGVRVALNHDVASLASVNLSDVVMYAQYPEKGGVDRFQGLLEIGGLPASESINRKK
ncbi:MAG TPA: hypothetical protein PKM44_00070 [Turneriella sp.]|nr:hypothetical protein [Turneriella sp.]HNJ65119.1 hypothetical protein [Turneriella sp.]HNL08877.1 hypothetical protein [Turneriella sp.]HNL53338.1 hypothetical protein [Turneriella sp.]HNM98802.1 hypothetical protein [Turneriella sp.]